MPKNAFGDEVQTNQFGDTIVAETPARVVAPAGPGFLSRAGAAMAEAASSADGYIGAGTVNQLKLAPDPTTPEVREAAMRYGLPITAGALAPATGGLSLLTAAAGGLTGEILAQKSEMDRGAREQASYGRMIAAPIMAGAPLGPEADLSVRAFGPAGRLLAVAPQAVVKRAAFGGLVGGVASGTEQAIDTGKIDVGEVVNSAAFGSLFGAALGGLESAQATRAAKKTIFDLRKATGNFQGSDADFLLWAKAQARRGAGPSMPAEEGASVPQEQTPALPEGYSEPSVNNFGDPVAPAPVAPENLTPLSSVVERQSHKLEVPGSTPGAASILQPTQENADSIPGSSPPVRDEAGAAPASEEVASGASGENLVAPEARIADASPQEENAILNPTAPPAPPAPEATELADVNAEASQELRTPPATPNFAIDSADQIDEWEAANRKFDADAVVAVFGAEKAKEYNKLQRQANGSNNERADAASAKIAEMESGLSKSQEDTLFGKNLPSSFIHPDDARELRATVADIDSASNVGELARSSSRLIQSALRASADGKPLEGRNAELTARVMRRAKEIGVSPQTLVKAAFAYRASIEGHDVFELAGVTPDQFGKFVSETAPPSKPASTAPGLPPATVKLTPAGPAISPKPAEDARVSQLADRKQFTAQKGFILDAVKAAHAAAPETGQGQVTIDVPGDGTFTVSNTKPSLKLFGDRIAKSFGKSFSISPTKAGFGGGRIYSPFSEPLEGSRTAPKPETIPAVKKNPTPADLGSAAELGVANPDDTRAALHHVLSEDGFAVASNGHQLFIAAGGAGKTRSELETFLKANAKTGDNGRIPAWQQVVPSYVKLKDGKVSVGQDAPADVFKINTAEAIKSLNQVLALQRDTKISSVHLVDLGKGKIGFAASAPAVGAYRSDGVKEDPTSATAVDPTYLKNAMLAARRAGHENVSLYIKDQVGPVVAIGGNNFAAITMPQRMDAGAKPAGAPVKAAAKVAAPARGTSGIGMPARPAPVSPALPAPPPGTTVGAHPGPMSVTMQPMTDKTIAMAGVMDALENIMRVVGLQTPIRHGRMAQRNALGVFKTWSEVIRNRREGDIPTAAHEVGHAVSKRIFGSVMSAALIKSLPFKPLAKELQALGKALYGPTRPAAGYTAEGFSELVRLWLTTEDAAKKAPLATGWLENSLFKNQPAFGQAMQQARDKIDIWRGQGAMERMNQQTAVDPGFMRRANTAVRSALTKRMLVDEFAPLEELAEGYAKITGKTLPASQDPNLIAQAYRRTAGAVLKQWVEQGVTDVAGNKTGPSLREAYARLKPSDEYPFHAYLFAKQAMIRLDQGKFAGIERQDAEWIIKNVETPAYVDAASKIADWWQAVRDYKREAYPAMNGPMLDAIEKANPVYYGPLAAALDPAKVKRAVSSRSGGGLYRFKGHGGPTKRIYEQSLFVAENIIGSAQRDMVMHSIVDLSKVEGMGWLVEEIPVSKVIEQLNIEKLRKQLEGWGLDTSNIPPDSLLEYATQMDEPKGTDPIIAVRVQTGIRPDGSPIMQPRWLQVPREVQEVIQGVHEPERLGPIFELLIGAPTRMFKLGTTGLRAGFSMITNPERDATTFMMQSIAENPAAKTKALLGAYKELVTSALTGNPGPYLEMFHQMGVSGSNFLGGDTQQAKREAKGLFHGKFFQLWSSPIENLREAMSFTESAPRLAELQLASNHFGWKPGTPLTLDQAVQIRLATKRVTTDFSAKGAMPPMLQRGLTGPFMNASVQGLRAFGRTWKENQGTFQRNRAALKGILNALTLITLPLLWNWWNNRDKEWYRRLPWRERYLYINVEAGQNVIQIPLPQEWGVAFGVLPVAAIDSLWQRDPRPIEEALKHAFAVLNPVDWPVPMQALKEQWQNKVDFFNRPIIPRSEIDLMPGSQRGPYTSWLAKTLGNAFPNTVSPRRVDAAIREVFGGAGADYSRSPEMMMKALGLKSDPRESEAADLPVIGRQFRRGGTFSEANQALTDFWDDQARYGAWLASATREVKQGGPPLVAMSPQEQLYAKNLNMAAPYVALAMRMANATPELVARQRIYRATSEMTTALVANRPKPNTGPTP